MIIPKELMRIMARRGLMVANKQIWLENRSSTQRYLQLKIAFQRNSTIVYKYTKM